MTLPYIFFAPIIGGVIGYITNAIAIRMLFRPHQAKYLFGHRIPFTPGIIPKEKGRIAIAIGDTISSNLMNQEVLKKNLLSDEMTGKIRIAIDDFFNTQKDNPETLQTFLAHCLPEQEIEHFSENCNKELTELVHHKLADSGIEDKIAHITMEHVMQKTFGMQGRENVPRFINGITERIEKILAKNIGEMLQNNSQEIIRNLISKEIGHLKSLPMNRFLAEKDAQIEHVKNSVIAFYRSMITERLPKILDTVNISRIVEGRINEMNMKDTERIIFEVMDKELKAIVWLGALLGLLMGFANLLIS